MIPNILIYRDQLLPYSETFIPSQVEHLQRYRGIYVGTSRLSQQRIALPLEKSICLNDLVSYPEFWKTALKLAGVIHPRWFEPIRDCSPLLVHAHFGLDALWASRLAKRLRLPLLITFRGSDITGMQPSRPGNPSPRLRDFINKRGQFYRDFYLQRRPRLFQEAKVCIGVSGFIRDRMLLAGCPENKATVVYNGVNLEQFTPDLALPRQPVVLFVGRLVEKKGCEYLIRAMAQVQAAVPEAELIVIGEGPLRPVLEHLAQQSLKAYRFLGSQPHTEVTAWMNRARVLATPSVTAANGDSEGLPNVVVEAQAMALPVVATRHAGIPEAVIHGKTGFLVAEKDVEGLAIHLIRLLARPELWQGCAIASRKHIEDNFDLRRNIEKLENIYTQVINTGTFSG
ncbi:MAG TPA: glycosyltransferase [Leptolyngbyaceae cyanobacterium]